jgi:protein-disulfide isomerase-like protein with CxxC motif
MRAPMLITILLFSSTATPVAIHAEQARAVPQVGILLPVQRADYDDAKDPLKAAFLDGLQALGYVEGKNIHVEVRVPRKPEEHQNGLAVVDRRSLLWGSTGSPARGTSGQLATLARATLIGHRPLITVFG